MPDSKRLPPASATGQDQTPGKKEPSEALPKVAPFLTDPLALDDQDAPPSTPTAAPTESDAVKKVEDAIRRLREKMASVATEFAQGKINQAQFEAVYRRYQEQRAITESLLARNPETDAWQHVLTEGPTTYLRSQHEARLESYTLYLNRGARPLLTHGNLGMDPQVLMALLRKIRARVEASGETGPASARFAADRWLVYVRGQHATALATYANQPTPRQLRLIGDLHTDFETANQRRLTAEQFTPADLVYPQRALFDVTPPGKPATGKDDKARR